MMMLEITDTHMHATQEPTAEMQLPGVAGTPPKVSVL